MHSHDHAMHGEKRSAAISSVLWSALLTIIKIIAGVETNSLGILSEALHSSLDFCAAAITFYAVRMAARPADANHPFGHEKVESLSALIETGLLLVTCVWISWEAVERLFFQTPHLELTWWAFAVVAVSIVVDINRSAMLRRVAKKHDSQALEADALHFTTDIWSSSVVLLGLICVWGASFFPPESLVGSILLKADSIAGLAVAAIVCGVAFGLAKRSVHSLLDGGSEKLACDVEQALLRQLPGYPVLRMRLRDAGSRSFVELTIGAPAELHVDEAHDITEEVERIIRTVIPNADAVVHVEPENLPGDASPEAIAHTLAIRHHLLVHGYAEASRNHDRIVFLDIEMPPQMLLSEARSSLGAYEKDLKTALHLSEVISRIEPTRRGIVAIAPAQPVSEEDLCDNIRTIAENMPEAGPLARIEISEMNGYSAVTVFTSADSSMSVEASHQIAAAFEQRIATAFPALGKIAVILVPSANPLT